MTTLQLTLPEKLREFLDRQVAEGHYPSASDYLCALLQEAQERQAREKVEALLLEGLQAREPSASTPAYREEKR